MNEITAEICTWIDRAAENIVPEEDEYRSDMDGLLHCKQCDGRGQTVVPRFGRPGYLTLRIVSSCQQGTFDQKA